MLDDKMNCGEKKLIVNKSKTGVEHRFSWLCEVPVRSQIGKPFQSNKGGGGEILKQDQRGGFKIDNYPFNLGLSFIIWHWLFLPSVSESVSHPILSSLLQWRPCGWGVSL